MKIILYNKCSCGKRKWRYAKYCKQCHLKILSEICKKQYDPFIPNLSALDYLMNKGILYAKTIS